MRRPGVPTRVGARNEGTVKCCYVRVLVLPKVIVPKVVVAKGLEIVGKQPIALQPVRVKGQHARTLLHEALVSQLVGLHPTSQDVIAEAHELVAGRVPISSVSRHG